jgi:cell division septal protein FtsQ
MARRPTTPEVRTGTRTRAPSALRPGARPGGGVRRTRPVRRASAGLTPTRAGALLALLLGLAGLYGIVASGAFSVRNVEVTGLTWTSRDDVLAALAIPADQNLFTVRSGDLERRLVGLPAINGATISILLPDTIRVAVKERVGLLRWQVGNRQFLVDEGGELFDELGDPTPPEAASLPVVDDRRELSAGLTVGSTLDPVILDAALRLGSLRPVDVGSAAPELTIRLDDDSGFAVRAPAIGWTAVFGFYTPTLRTTDLIPGQVRLLRSLLAGKEDTVLRVILADDRSGTYIPRATPEPTATPKPK